MRHILNDPFDYIDPVGAEQQQPVHPIRFAVAERDAADRAPDAGRRGRGADCRGLADMFGRLQDLDVGMLDRRRRPAAFRP
ncbi:hypothetical protein OKW76_04560 [Sphingomonas sp. S1-29]|uniref:hypothetical protein n=1 Tax=Sphingomonas sp. S1-29 TaxID=2991074 RepID=UPI00223FE2AA|nr:hypothetical protein [Sphingomonas sp. S1-29]UZK70323.1 hypothetical protein OKW76_04560 [Sphingomonas sp. S1-29]